MPIIDYYKILEISSSAGSGEVKAAFRRLAKLYHPDKDQNNKDAAEKFWQIKQAYETLINPAKRLKYDSKKKHEQSYIPRKTSNRKTRTTEFSEEELKRRKYYGENYKTVVKSKSSSKQTTKHYNEIWYILYSIPVAVALLLFIINRYGDNNVAPQKKTSDSVKTIEAKR